GELNHAQREDVEVVARSGRHLLHLVDDVLDLSAIASGRFEISRKPVDLVPLVHELVREAKGRARSKHVTLVIEGVSSAIVQAAPGGSRRGAPTVVPTASERAGGRVVEKTARRGQTAPLSVGDNGPGIPRHDLKRLFKPFEQGHSNKGARGGAGLGLAI